MRESLEVKNSTRKSITLWSSTPQSDLNKDLVILHPGEKIKESAHLSQDRSAIQTAWKVNVP